jgi:hypothetical protein
MSLRPSLLQYSQLESESGFISSRNLEFRDEAFFFSEILVEIFHNVHTSQSKVA